MPNPNYYGPQPQLTKLIYPFYKDVATNFEAYQAGQTDYAQGIPTTDLATAKALPNNQYQLVPQLWINYYTMNYLVKPFDNIHIRQAFCSCHQQGPDCPQRVEGHRDRHEPYRAQGHAWLQPESDSP